MSRNSDSTAALKVVTGSAELDFQDRLDDAKLSAAAIVLATRALVQYGDEEKVFLHGLEHLTQRHLRELEQLSAAYTQLRNR